MPDDLSNGVPVREIFIKIALDLGDRSLVDPDVHLMQLALKQIDRIFLQKVHLVCQVPLHLAAAGASRQHGRGVGIDPRCGRARLVSLLRGLQLRLGRLQL